MPDWRRSLALWTCISIIAWVISLFIQDENIGEYLVPSLSLLTMGIIAYTLFFPYSVASDITGRRILPRGNLELQAFIASYTPHLLFYVLLLAEYSQVLIRVLDGWLALLITIPGVLMTLLILYYGLYRPQPTLPSKILIVSSILIIEATIWSYILLATTIMMLGAIDILTTHVITIHMEPYRYYIHLWLLALPAASITLSLIDLTLSIRRPSIPATTGYSPLSFRRHLLSRITARLFSSYVITLQPDVYSDLVRFLGS